MNDDPFDRLRALMAGFAPANDNEWPHYGLLLTVLTADVTRCFGLPPSIMFGDEVCDWGEP